MKGAIIGDIVGSVYEHHNIKTKACGFLDEELQFDVEFVYNLFEKFPQALEDTHLTVEELSVLPRDERRKYIKRFRRGIRTKKLRDFLEKEDTDNSQPDNKDGLRVEVLS